MGLTALHQWWRTVVVASLFVPCLGAASQTLTPIHSIMTGLPNTSYLGQSVSVSGVVVGVMSSGGFYITAPNSGWDGSNATAEGMPIFYAAGANPACAVVGNIVTVSGSVTNGTAVNGANTPGTGIAPTSCTVTGAGSVSNTITLSSATAYAQDLPFTGTPATNTVFNAVSPTGGTVPDPTTGIVASNGQFWADLATPTNGHLFKSAGLEADNFYPQSPPAPAKGSSPGIPTWLGNPQRLLIDTTTFGGTPMDLGAGQTLTCKAGGGLTVGAVSGVGVIDYSLGYNRLLIFKTTTCTISGNIAPSITSPADATHFHVGTLNLNRFAGSASPAYQTRLAKAALAIVNIFGKPDILSVQEVQDLPTLQAIGDAASALAGSGTTYQAFFAPANDATSLSLGFLVNTQNVLVSKVYQVNATDSFTTYGGTTEPLWERPPYVLEAYLLRNGLNYQVEVANIEITSRAGIDDPTSGVNVWQRRGAQAEELSIFANQEQLRGQNLLIAGEYNAYSFSDGFADPVDIIAGTGPPAQGAVAQYEPSMTATPMYNFVKSITVSNSTYNVIEQGNARSIEHILCSETQNASASGSIYSYITAVTQPHWTTDFPAVTANDPTVPQGLTLFDGFVGAFLIPPVPTSASLAPAALNFGNVFRGASSTQTTTLTNTSTFPSTVSVTGLQSSGANASDFSATSNCAGVTQGSTCSIVVTFTPSAAGARSATLTVSSDAGAEPTFTVTLTGTGVDTTSTLSPASATFPSLYLTASSAAQTFIFTNTGGLAETVSSASVSGDYAIIANTCGAASLAPSASCTVSVVFTPSVAGTRNGVLTVNNSATLNPTLTASLFGTGLPTTATLSPVVATYAATLVGSTTAAQTFVWTNTSGVPLTISSVSAAGDFAITASNCSGSIAANASCSVSVAFTPILSGTRTGVLTVQSSSSANPALTAALTGTGVLDVVTSLTSLSFGNVDIGATSTPLSFTVTNYSAQTITITSLTSAGDYAYTTTCAATLAAGKSCTVAVTFKPTALGLRSGVFTINTADPRAPTVTVALQGNGVDFSLAVTPVAGGPLDAGRNIYMTVTVSPISGYSAPVALRCLLPSNVGGSTCGPTVSVPLNGPPAAISATITTTAQYTVIGYGSIGGGSAGKRSLWFSLLGALSMAWLCFARRRARWGRAVALTCLLAILGVANLACSGRYPDRNQNPTYPGVYIYTFSATDGFLTRTATYTLTVQVK